MSTWIYLECLSHDPILRSEGESGQHLYDLPQVREDYANREALTAAARVDAWPDHWFRRNTIRFLMDHPRCSIGIRDEYGDVHPMAEEQP